MFTYFSRLKPHRGRRGDPAAIERRSGFRSVCAGVAETVCFRALREPVSPQVDPQPTNADHRASKYLNFSGRSSPLAGRREWPPGSALPGQPITPPNPPSLHPAALPATSTRSSKARPVRLSCPRTRGSQEAAVGVAAQVLVVVAEPEPGILAWRGLRTRRVFELRLRQQGGSPCRCRVSASLHRRWRRPS